MDTSLRPPALPPAAAEAESDGAVQEAANVARALLTLHDARFGHGDTGIAVGACALTILEAAERGIEPDPAAVAELVTRYDPAADR